MNFMKWLTTFFLFFTDWNELFTTKCVSCGFPIEAGDRWVEALNNNYHSQCFNCTVSVSLIPARFYFRLLFYGKLLKSHWGKNLDLSKKLYFEQTNFHKIYIFKVSFLTNFTFSKSHFWQNSHFQILIFDRIHIFRISFLTKFTFLEPNIW